MFKKIIDKVHNKCKVLVVCVFVLLFLTIHQFILIIYNGVLRGLYFAEKMKCYSIKKPPSFFTRWRFFGFVLLGYYCNSTFFENIALPAFNCTTYTPFASPCVEMLCVCVGLFSVFVRTLLPSML